MSNNQAIATVPKKNSLVGTDMDELNEIAKWAVSSGMFSDVKTVSQGGMKILAGREMGIPPVRALTAFHFIQNRVVPSADLLASLVKQSKRYNYRVLEHTRKKCVIEFWEFFNGGWQKMGVPVEYGEEDAKAEKAFEKATYKSFADDMYFAAAMRKGVRRYCPDVTKGTEFMQVSEEQFFAAEAESEGLDAAEVERRFSEDFSPEEPTPFPFENEPDAIDAEFVETETGDGEQTGEGFITEEEARLYDLRDRANEIVSMITGGDEGEIKKLLKGKQIENMTSDQLEKFIKDNDQVF